MPLTITRIPALYRPGLAKIKTLSSTAVGALADSLQAAQAAHVSGLAELSGIVERTTQVSPDEAVNIVVAVRSLYLLKAGAESTAVPDFVAMVVTAMQMTGGDLALAESEKPVYAEKLTRLLSIGSLERSTKVEQLKADHQSILEDAKIVTDLRPVFDKPGERPVGAIITHTLKIVNHESGEHKELYFAIDSEDVLTLKRIAERSLEKTNSLKDFIESANIEDLT